MGAFLVCIECVSVDACTINVVGIRCLPSPVLPALKLRCHLQIYSAPNIAGGRPRYFPQSLKIMFSVTFFML